MNLHALLLLLLIQSGAAFAAGLPGRDAIVVSPGQDGLVGDADAASQGTIDVHPAEPRTLRVSVTLRF